MAERQPQGPKKFSPLDLPHVPVSDIPFFVRGIHGKRDGDPSQEVKMPDLRNYTDLPTDLTFENPGPEAAR